MVLNMAQTWHQVRPGEVRTDCGGCHAHSQKPTDFKLTAAARPDYAIFDLTERTPLLTAKASDQSGKQWDVKDETGLRFEKHVKNVEYFRDIKPIFERSCVACHTAKDGREPAGKLVLDDDTRREILVGGGMFAEPPAKVPDTYGRLAGDQQAKFGHKSPTIRGTWSRPQASRYVRYFQARRSLLMWKVYGQRLDGWSNDDFAYESVPGDPNTLVYKGKPIAKDQKTQGLINLAHLGSAMPPPEAVDGTYMGAGGKKIKVAPLTDEDRKNLARWIDLGCPIDLAYDLAHPEVRGRGWQQDDNRPTLALAYPHAGANTELTRILVGMHDYDTGLDMESFQVTADFAVAGVPAGTNLASKFKALPEGRWELAFPEPIRQLSKGELTVSVKDRQGNISRIERTFSVGPTPVKN
jgi:hypothetical protein